ncbi:MAG: xylulokinase [Trueperaceae bacterium]
MAGRSQSIIGLGLDVGTSGLKALAVDEHGQVVAEAEESYPLLTPRPGWSEQEPEAWWAAARTALKELSGRLPASGRVVALGLSGQMHGMVALDGKGSVVRPALLWNDQRTGDAVRAIERAVPRRKLIERTGNPAITGFQVAKVVWLKANEPDAFAATEHVLFPKDFLGYRLTGEMYAEPSDASGSNVFNLHAMAWDGDILGALGLPARLWPQVVPSKAVVGHVLPRLAEELGLPEGLDVVAGAGDNAAAGYGMGLGQARPRLGSVSLGTSGVVFAPQAEPKPDPDGRVHLFCHADGGYHLLGVTLAAAGSLRWFRDTFAANRSFDELLELAADVAPGAGGVTFKPYLAGERTPHLDPDLRGSLHGLSLATGLPELVRAVLEGVAFSLRDALSVVSPLAPIDRALLIGGGGRSKLWGRLLADVLEIPLGISTAAHGAAYGAARLALETAGAPSPLAESGRYDQRDARWLEPGDYEPYASAYRRYRELGPEQGASS